MNERKSIKELLDNVERIDQYLTEKVEWKRNLNSLLRKFNYNPDKGTIKYQGNDYKVEFSRKCNTSVIQDISSNPTKKESGTLLNKDKSKIIINPDDFRYRSLENMETSILHEIGHMEVNHNTKSLDPLTTTHNVSDEFRKYIDKNHNDGTEFLQYYKFNDYNKDRKEFIITKIIDKKNSGKELTPNESKILEKYGQKYNKNLTDKERKAAVERNKFAGATENLVYQRDLKQSGHANQSEYEADRYAADHLEHGNSRLGKFIRHAYDKNYNDVKNDIPKKVIDLIDKEKGIESKSLKDKIKDNRDAKDKSSRISKEIETNLNRSLNDMKNDTKSRLKAIEASKQSDTKSFTTLNDKGTDKDSDNKPYNVNGKRTQRNMLSHKNK